MESTRTARATNEVSRAALAITLREISATTSGPNRRVSFQTVLSSGTRTSIAIRQNRRRCNESEISRIALS